MFDLVYRQPKCILTNNELWKLQSELNYSIGKPIFHNWSNGLLEYQWLQFIPAMELFDAFRSTQDSDYPLMMTRPLNPTADKLQFNPDLNFRLALLPKNSEKKIIYSFEIIKDQIQAGGKPLFYPELRPNDENYYYSFDIPPVIRTGVVAWQFKPPPSEVVKMVTYYNEMRDKYCMGKDKVNPDDFELSTEGYLEEKDYDEGTDEYSNANIGIAEN